MNFPDLRNAKLIALDTETCDPELLDAGPGWGRNRGYVVGISCAVEGHSWYFPIRHQGGGNLPLENVLQWAADNISGTPDVPKVFANAQYDIGWLLHEGIPVSGRVHDVQLAEPLIDEHCFSYSLDTLAKKYLNTGKHEDEMYAELQRRYGGKKGRAQAGNIWRAEASLVEQYAKVDAELLLGILPKQLKIIRDEQLRDVYDMECKLVHLLIDMRMRGVRVDVDKAQRIYDEYTTRVDKLNKKFGGIEIAKAADIAKYCDKNGISYGRTATGLPQFQGAWLRENIPEIAEMRRLTKAKDTFVKGYILDKHVDGRVHGQFNQLRSDDYGTVSGRLSACIPAHVLVATDNGHVPMGDIKKGDYVWTHKNKFRKVLNKWFTGYHKTFRISLKNGATVECTSNHRLLTDWGWLSLEDIYEREQGTTGRSKDAEASAGHLFGAGQADSGNCSRDFRNGLPHRWSDIEEMLSTSNLCRREKIALRKKQARRKKSYAWKISRAASQFQGSNTWQGRLHAVIKASLVHWKQVAEAYFAASCSYVRSFGNNRSSKRVPCSSYQWRQVRQQIIKSGIGIASGTCCNTPSYSTIKSIEFVGVLPVYDLEIASDHCFLAGGIFVHNSSPNLQNIPARDEEIGPLVRSMFLPDEGEVISSQDWSQIEFRMFAHYANDPELVEAYKQTGTDFHKVVAQMFGNLIPRKIIKNFNFMLLYGGGVNKLAAMLMDNLTDEESHQLLDSLINDMPTLTFDPRDDLHTKLARVLMAAYQIKFPAAKRLADLASRTAKTRGYVRTLMGRRARFNNWAPSKWDPTGTKKPLPYAEAIAAYGPQISRSGVHKTLNSILQGSAADVMKQTMVAIMDSGVLDVLGAPLLTVHDELVFSAPRTLAGKEALQEAAHLMCTSVKLRVPLAVDVEIGPNWGDVAEDRWEYFENQED